METETVLHKVCYPPHYDVEGERAARAAAAAAPALRPPAKKYPFVLDPFQARAISCLERQQSVLVSAHTRGVCECVCCVNGLVLLRH